MVNNGADEDLAAAQFGHKMRKLHDWERLTAGEVEDVVRVRGFSDRYEKAAEMVPREMLDQRVARDLFVQDITGASAAQLKTKAPQLQVAKGLLGLSDPSDAAFDAGMREYVAAKVATRDLREKAARAVEMGAIQGRPRREVLREQADMAGEKWGEVEPIARGVMQQIEAEFGENERRVARDLFERTAEEQGEAVQALDDPATLGLLEYGRMDQAQREQVLLLMAIQAEAEGRDVNNYFARLGNAVKAGAGRIGTGMVAQDLDAQAQAIRTALKTGKRVAGDDAVAGAIPYGKRVNTLGGRDDGQFPMGEVVEITDEERAELEAAAEITEGQVALMADIRENGIRLARVVDERREGFWDTAGDWTVMAAESLPMMASMALPYGIGVMDYALTAAEENRASLRAQTGSTDLTATQDRVALASGLTEAGVEKLQWMTLGARVPRLKAAMLRRGKLGAAGVFGARVGAVTAMETGQEVFQNVQLPLMQEVAGALAADVPEVDWQDVLDRELEALPDTFGVSLVFGVIGGLGSTSADYLGRGKLQQALRDRKGLELDGLPAEVVEAVATEAETNPLAAAEELKAAHAELSPEQRAENAARALEAQQREAAEAEWEKERAKLPEIERDDDGTMWVVYPDGRRDEAVNEEDAVAAVRSWELDETADMAEAAREAAAFLEESHEGNPELAATARFTGRTVTLADWAGDSKVRLEQARARVRILMRQEGMKDADTVPDAQLPLGAYLLRGESRNFGGVATRIAMDIHKQGSVDVVVEEHAEGVAKWLMAEGKMTREEMVRNIQATERATRRETLQDPNDDQQVIEAFSRLAVANFFGKVPETRGLSAKFKAVLKAFAEAFSAILDLARGIREIQLAGQMDEDFERWLDVAGGVDMAYRKANLDRQVEQQQLEEGFAGLPAVSEALRGKLPHPETLKQAGHPQAGEVARIYEGIREQAGSKSAGTRKANGYFLPEGQMEDLDDVRQRANEEGFEFDTPGEMLDALDLAVNYGREQYGQAAGLATFSIEKNDEGGKNEWVHENHAVGRTGDAQASAGGLTEEIARAVEEAVASEATSGAERSLGEGSESFVFRLGDRHVLKRTKDRGAWTYARQGGLIRSTAPAALVAKAEVIGALDGLPTSVVSADGEAVIIQDRGTPITRSEFEQVELPGGIRPASQPSLRLEIDGREYLVSDLSQENFLKDADGVVRLADPVAGEVNPGAGFLADVSDSTLSIARADSPLLAAIEAQAKAPARKAAVYARMRDKVAEVRKRFEARRYSQPLTLDAVEGEEAGRFEVLRDMAMLEAMAKALPPEIRGKVIGSFRKVEGLKTTKAREKYLTNLLPRVEKALERHLDGLFRQAIRKVLDKGSPKVSESRKRGGKIGAVGHAIFAEAKRAMTLEPAEAEAASAALTERIEGGEAMDRDQLDELEGKRRAIELFHDYENADSARLEQALGFIDNVYSAGREEWLDVLMARKEARTARVERLAEGLGYQPRRAARAAAVEADKGLLKSLDEGMMAQGLSGAQTIRRLAENTRDPEVKALVEEMERAFQDAEANESDLNLAANEEMAQALRRILGIKGKWLKEWELTAKLKELADAKKEVPVTTIEGRKEVEITVPVRVADALLRREISGYDYRGERVEVNLAQLDELEKQMERLEELPEDKQRRVQVVKVMTREAVGARMSLGKWSQLDGLQLWLTLRQADQREKLEAMGYDQQTRTELDEWLKPEVKELGLWMAEQLERDQGAIDALHRSEKGVGLALVDHYFPVRNDVSRADSGGLALDGGQPQQTGRSVSFIMERVTNRATPAKVNALAVYLGHRAQQNFWRSHVTAMREWGGVIRDERFSAAVKATMGDKYYQALVQRLERIEGGGRVAGAKVLGYDRLLKAVMRRFAMGTLGMRLSTLMVNTTAALNVFLEHDAREVWAGMVKALKRPEAFKDAWESPAIRRRLAEGATFEAKLAKAHGPGLRPVIQQMERWAEAGVAPINYIDTGANLLGAASIWELTRTKALAADPEMTEEQARAEADAAVERLFQRAAQPTQRLSRSEMELRALENPLAALFSLFVSEPRKNLAIAYLAGRELVTGKGVMGRRQAVQSMATSLVAMIAMEYAVRTLYAAVFKADEDDEDEILARWWEKLTDAKAWTHRILAGHLVGVPVWGQGLEFGAGKIVNELDWLPGEKVMVFNTSPSPLMRGIGQVGKGIDVLTGSSDAVAEDTVDVVQALSPVPGMPLFSQLANASEPITGFWKGKISGEERIKRLLARYRALDRDLGKVKDEDGRLDREKQQAKDAALVDYLRAHRAEMPADLQPRLMEVLREKLPARILEQLGDL